RGVVNCYCFFFSSRRRHTRFSRDWSSDVCSSDLAPVLAGIERARDRGIAVKLNAVLIQDYNHDQILPLVAWARSRQLPLRFIERSEERRVGKACRTRRPRSLE